MTQEDKDRLMHDFGVMIQNYYAVHLSKEDGKTQFEFVMNSLDTLLLFNIKETSNTTIDDKKRVLTELYEIGLNILDEYHNRNN